MDETVNHKNLQSDVIRMNASSQRTNKKEIEYLKALSDGPLIVGGGKFTGKLNPHFKYISLMRQQLGHFAPIQFIRTN